MPLIYQHRIYRTDLKHNPEVRYVFGDNTLRKGMGGQAGEMRGEPNAIGVVTKFFPSTAADAYFTDARMKEQMRLVSNDLVLVMKALREGRIVVWPSDGIGSGLSEVPTRAPETWAWMERVRQHIEATHA